MKKLGFVLAGAMALYGWQASAAEKNPISGAVPSAPGTRAPMVPGGEPPGDPVSLVIDDGGNEDCIGLTAGGSFFWLNRFTPVEYPIGLSQISILWGAVGCNIVNGNQFDLATYRDTNNNPADGATNVSSHPLINVTAVGSFQVVPVTGVTFNTGPGDVLIGVVNRTGMNAAGQFPAAIDQTATQVRSWVGFAGVPPTPPPVPFGTFGTIDSFGFPGNWTVRGAGTVVPVELQDFSIQ